MKITFVSNYFNHHQKPLCDELYLRFGQDFSFISTCEMREERKKLGYSQNSSPEYVVLAYEDKDKFEYAKKKIDSSDVVIAGSTPKEYIVDRIRDGKTILWYTERPFKKKISLFRRLGYSVLFRIRNCGNKKTNILCASAYASKDYASVGMFKNRMYKWGYFPETKQYNINELTEKKEKHTLLWCGRFIDWKHPDDAVKIAKRLKEQGYDFELKIIGTGVMEEKLHQMVENYGLENCVKFLGSMAPETVRKNMESAGVFLATSDYQEGWGAVLNEAMNSGCAIVACNAIGSVPYLLTNGANGFTYNLFDEEKQFLAVKTLLDNPDLQNKLGLAAYRTIKEVWNAQKAAERLITLAERIDSGDSNIDIFDFGPCSKA